MRSEGQTVTLARWDGVLALVALAAILALLLAWPGGLLDKADHAAYAVCHRIADHSFIVGGRPLPLCARCSGTYLGTLAGAIVLVVRGRGRATCLPRRRYLAVLAGFFLAWGFDGLNSYLTLFPVLPHLYQPHNLLRLVTGILEGLAISAVFLPLLNPILWAGPVASWRAGEVSSLTGGSSVASWADMAWLLVGGAVVVAAVGSEWAALLYPLALLSGLMVIVLVGAVNGLVVLALLRREGTAQSWHDLAMPLLWGVVAALVELTLIGLLRAELTVRLGLPF